jgi:hypothetical protein
MIVELFLAGVALLASLKMGGVGVKEVAKLAAIKRLIDQARRIVKISAPQGQLKVVVDEFFYDDGEVAVDFALMEKNGRVFVLSRAETEILAKAEFLGQLVDSEVEISSSTWRRCIAPILRAVKARGAEIEVSPTRRALAA